MNKLINPNDYLKLSTYSEKYGISKRKLYRYVEDDRINFIVIDGIPFIKDEVSLILEANNSGKKIKDNVKNLTFKEDNVKNLTFKEDNVKFLTFKNRLSELESIPENQLKIKDFQEIDDLKKLIKD